jgi:8-oxo-dGTP diphosphatase
MDNRYPIPTVRLIVPDPDNHVLILKRSPSGYSGVQWCFPGVRHPCFSEDYSPSEYAGGQWCLPGGKVDYGFTVQETVTKELAEETSLVCTEAKFLFYQDSLPMESGGMHCINFYFQCRVSGAVHLNEESSEFAWIGLDELDRYSITFRNDWALKRFWKIE